MKFENYLIEKYLGESILNEGKKEKLISFIKNQINFDITPYVNHRYGKNKYLAVDLDKVPGHIEPQIKRLQDIYGKNNFRIEPNGGLGYAFWYGDYKKMDSNSKRRLY